MKLTKITSDKNDEWIDRLSYYLEDPQDEFDHMEPTVGIDDYDYEPTNDFGNFVDNVKGAQQEDIKHLPHVQVLYGAPGTGKSVWANALAHKLGFSFTNIDMSNIKGKWVGDIRENFRRIVNTILNSQDVVFLIDEIDKQLGIENEGEQDELSTHLQLGGQLLEDLIDILDKYSERLVEYNIFIIITTNADRTGTWRRFNTFHVE